VLFFPLGALAQALTPLPPLIAASPGYFPLGAVFFRSALSPRR
jgi:hypothetical protein